MVHRELTDRYARRRYRLPDGRTMTISHVDEIDGVGGSYFEIVYDLDASEPGFTGRGTCDLDLLDRLVEIRNGRWLPCFVSAQLNKSLDASGGSVFLNLIRPAILDGNRAAASTQTLGVFFFIPQGGRFGQRLLRNSTNHCND